LFFSYEAVFHNPKDFNQLHRAIAFNVNPILCFSSLSFPLSLCNPRKTNPINIKTNGEQFHIKPAQDQFTLGCDMSALWAYYRWDAWNIIFVAPFPPPEHPHKDKLHFEHTYLCFFPPPVRDCNSMRFGLLLSFLCHSQLYFTFLGERD